MCLKISGTSQNRFTAMQSQKGMQMHHNDPMEKRTITIFMVAWSRPELACDQIFSISGVNAAGRPTEATVTKGRPCALMKESF